MNRISWRERDYERVPNRRRMSEKAWLKWCDERDFHCLGNFAGSRGAWIFELNTYIRSANWLVYEGGRLVDIADNDEVPREVLGDE